MTRVFLLNIVCGWLLLNLLDYKAKPQKTLQDKANFIALWIILYILIDIRIVFITSVSYPIIDFFKFFF